jgi:hypothetical protein
MESETNRSRRIHKQHYECHWFVRQGGRTILRWGDVARESVTEFSARENRSEVGTHMLKRLSVYCHSECLSAESAHVFVIVNRQFLLPSRETNARVARHDISSIVITWSVACRGGIGTGIGIGRTRIGSCAYARLRRPAHLTFRSGSG